MMQTWRTIAVGFWLLLAALPASSTYQLNSYGFGSGGTADSGSTNYRINGSAGELQGKGTSAHYAAGAGENYEKQANVPIVTLTNSANWYNKLLVQLDPQNNPSDAKFAIAISSDGFTTTQYVKSDFTVGSTLTFADYQTYAGWGSGSGQLIRGLHRSTVYSVKAKAYRGVFTESGYGPVATAATVDPTLTFDIDVSATDTSTNPPYIVNFGGLPVSTVTDSPVKIWVTLDTNGENGGTVYLNGHNSGLTSASSTYTIGSVTGDLSALTEGFGAQGASATQTSGGPLALVSPYDGSGANVGVVDTVIREIFTTPAAVTAGRGSLLLKAKTKPLTPASADYTETITMVASGAF
ncbi:MAG TPA: hypothetical protein VI322_01795 [Candidatus Saccharimonadia bacterium]